MATMQKVIRVGSSIAAILPKTLLKEAGISAGTRISVERTPEGFLVRPVRSTKKGRALSADEQVAETALGLIKRYRVALKRLSDA